MNEMLPVLLAVLVPFLCVVLWVSATMGKTQ
jgi:hypothetical protein